MVKIKADSEEFKKLVDNFNDCLKIYNESIDDYFMEFRKHQGWFGSFGEEYYNNLLSKEEIYTSFGKTLNDFLDMLLNAYQELEKSNAATKEIS